MNKGDRRGSLNSVGFTIIETLIVLAVTGLLFVTIVGTLSEQQDKAEFVDSVHAIQSQIQQTINQVSAGYYPNNGNFDCTSTATGITIQSGNNQQGTNQPCLFLGKIIQFDVQNTNPEEYLVYTVAGCNYASLASPNPCSSPSTPDDFQATEPIIGSATFPNGFAAQSQTLEYGLSTYTQNTSPSDYIGGNLGAIGFLTELGSFSDGSYASGTQQVDLLTIARTHTGMTPISAVSAIDNSLASGSYTINPTSGVEVCFVSGGTQQSGLITIGNSGNQLSVKLNLYSNQSCS